MCGSAVVLARAAGAGDEVCDGGVDVGDLAGGSEWLTSDRGNVLAKTVDLVGAGDGHNAQGLGEQLSERTWPGMIPVRAATFDQINDGLVGGKV